MRKFAVKLATAVLSLGLCLGIAGLTNVFAKNGPNKGEECTAYIMATVGEDKGLEYENICDKNRGYFPAAKDFEGIDYDEKTNTLTLTNFKGDRIETNEMGDDFKIRLVGDNTLEMSMVVWGYGYGGSVTFIGDGTLTLGRLYLQAELSDATLTVKDSAKVTVYCPDDHGLDYPAFAIFGTTVGKNAINAKYSAEVAEYTYDTYETATIPVDGYEYTLATVEKGGKKYGIIENNSIDFETGDWYVESIEVYDLNGKLIETVADNAALEKAGYKATVVGKSYTYKIPEAKVIFTANNSSASAEAPKKGTVITYSGNDYKVTKVGTAKSAGTVAFYAAKAGVKALTIPATIKVDGITYKVTSIAEKAVQNNPTLTSVTIGKNVKTIGAKAFYNCKKLTEIKISTTKLTKTTVKSGAFKSINTGCKVTVPSGLVKNYKAILQNAGLSTKISVK